MVMNNDNVNDLLSESFIASAQIRNQKVISILHNNSFFLSGVAFLVCKNYFENKIEFEQLISISLSIGVAVGIDKEILGIGKIKDETEIRNMNTEENEFCRNYISNLDNRKDIMPVLLGKTIAIKTKAHNGIERVIFDIFKTGISLATEFESKISN